MIQINKLSLSFGSQTVFEDVSATIYQNDRVGLVGRNGTGKSTLLKILAKEQDTDSGTISIQKNTTIAYMPQTVVLKSTKTVFEEALSTYEKLYALSIERDALAAKIDGKELSAEATERYAQIEETLQESGWNRTRARVQETLQGLGFDKVKQDGAVDALSVGWKMRLLLAKLLLQDADFYFFDEPTNHLDLVTKQWFLQFLKKASFGFVIVCHDRYILDQLCTSIFEVSRGDLKKYFGNYTKYLQTKAEQAEQLKSAYDRQQQLIKEKTNWIAQNKAKASKAKQAQSMLKQINKLDRIELEGNVATVAVRLPEISPSGQHVFSVENVSHSFDRPIFKNVTFSVERGEKISIIAPNGTGKTTLFNVIAGKLPLQSGKLTPGNYVSVALFDQDQSKILDPESSVFEEVSRHCKATDQEIRNMLGAFLFPSDAMYKKTKVLSGGERNRVAMVKVLLQKANFIMLDEPTNHLDIETKEIILKALQKYTGTILFVSHDQEFVTQLATRIIELDSTGVTSYLGNYDDYLLQKQNPTSNNVGTVNNKSEGKSLGNSSASGDLKKQSRDLEVRINRIQKNIDAILEKICDYEYGSPEYNELEARQEPLEQELAQVTAEWEKCFEQLNKE